MLTQLYQLFFPSYSPLYGEESEFYLLSVKCFQRHTGEYQYTVCPFRQVQQKHQKQLTGLNLGRKPAWYNLSKVIRNVSDRMMTAYKRFRCLQAI